MQLGFPCDSWYCWKLETNAMRLMQLQLGVCSTGDSGDSKMVNVVAEFLKPCMEFADSWYCMKLQTSAMQSMQLQSWLDSNCADSGDSKTLNFVAVFLKPCKEIMLMIIPYLDFCELSGWCSCNCGWIAAVKTLRIPKHLMFWLVFKTLHGNHADDYSSFGF